MTLSQTGIHLLFHLPRIYNLSHFAYPTPDAEGNGESTPCLVRAEAYEGDDKGCVAGIAAFGIGKLTSPCGVGVLGLYNDAEVGCRFK